MPKKEIKIEELGKIDDILQTHGYNMRNFISPKFEYQEDPLIPSKEYHITVTKENNGGNKLNVTFIHECMGGSGLESAALMSDPWSMFIDSSDEALLKDLEPLVIKRDRGTRDVPKTLFLEIYKHSKFL